MNHLHSISLETLPAPQSGSTDVNSSPVVREISFFVLVLFGFVGMLLMLMMSGCATSANTETPVKATAAALTQPNHLAADNSGSYAAVVAL